MISLQRAVPIVTSRPQKKVIRIIGQAIPAMMDSVVREPMAALDQAI
jgi:hypothetical protein